MTKESIARLLVGIFVLVAAALPFAGQWLSQRAQVTTIELHARMPENGGWSLDTIQASAGQPVHLHITSDDVVHGFAIGQSDQADFEIQPGEYVDTTLTFNQAGKYTYYCTRWCGPNHWRMRGTIEVTGAGEPAPSGEQPLFLKLGIAIDAPETAQVIPAELASGPHGAQFANRLPPYALEKDMYRSSSPANLWQRLRAENTLKDLSDSDLWDVTAWLWQRQTTPEALAEAKKRYAANCAACHGEKGAGDGVMVKDLPLWQPAMPMSDGSTPASTGDHRVRPPDFTDPKQLLGASPALLEGKLIRGGMGTGMPYWGPIFTTGQMDAIISYLYTFAWENAPFDVKASP